MSEDRFLGALVVVVSLVWFFWLLAMVYETCRCWLRRLFRKWL